MVCAVIVVSFVRGLYLDLERADPVGTLHGDSFSTIHRRRVCPPQRADPGGDSHGWPTSRPGRMGTGLALGSRVGTEVVEDLCVRCGTSVRVLRRRSFKSASC